MESYQLILTKYGELYLQGLGMTLQLTALSLAVGFVFAWPMAVALNSKSRTWRWPVRIFVYYATGTPLLVQLFMVYFGLGQFEAVRESVLWTLLREPYWCALLAFSLNTAAYSAEIFSGALRNTAAGEIEAAHAYGLGEWQVFFRIAAPSAMRRALPAYGNEIIFLMHGSSLASIITLLDLTGAARVAARGTFAFSESYLIAIAMYMGITAVLVGSFKLAENHFLAHLRPMSLQPARN